MLCTLGSVTTASMIANCSFGKSFATFSSVLPWLKPMPTIGVAPRSAIRRLACSRWVGLLISNSRYVLPVSFFQRSAPSKPAWLKLLSNLPPMS